MTDTEAEDLDKALQAPMEVSGDLLWRSGPLGLLAELMMGRAAEAEAGGEDLNPHEVVELCAAIKIFLEDLGAAHHRIDCWVLKQGARMGLRDYWRARARAAQPGAPS